MKSTKKPISYRYRGRDHVGSFVVSKGIVTVTAADGREKPTQVGGSPPKVIAERLLSELVREADTERRDALKKEMEEARERGAAEADRHIKALFNPLDWTAPCGKKIRDCNEKELREVGDGFVATGKILRTGKLPLSWTRFA